ncbi:hypothetical protein AVEN_31326-1 [Araneus ventricosus]|uniref:Uncharacterized protein n=1 Tax=Araneus ventricosus TaxID=182803 RepID=A0A4Y2S829_ARAVE|nr:hypothetical protein AVEN_31326-1 [Araneus ventricosus]
MCALFSVVGSQGIVVARGFVGWLDCSGEVSVNTRTSNPSESTDGDLGAVPTSCCRWRCVVGAASWIPSDNKSPRMTSSHQATDRWNKDATNGAPVSRTQRNIIKKTKIKTLKLFFIKTKQRKPKYIFFLQWRTGSENSGCQESLRAHTYLQL